MKNGYKHKTGTFGTAAENYVSRTFMLLKNPNGNRRPDLVSAKGIYSPTLTIEVKSGRKAKGILVDYQLHYAIRTVETYRELFGEDPPAVEVKTELFDHPIKNKGRLERADAIAYYYCVVDRIDSLKSDDIDRPYSTLKCRWGNMFLVPAEYAFHSFMAARVSRTGENEREVISELREIMRQDAISWNSTDYISRKLNPNSWQNLNGRDILSVFQNDESILTAKGKKRMDILSGNYDELSSLKRVRIDGPNSTSIYVLSRDRDYDLFNSQVRKVVDSRIPLIERITHERAASLPMLDMINIDDSRLWFDFEDSGKSAQRKAAQTLKFSEICDLERRVKWISSNEDECMPMNGHRA